MSQIRPKQLRLNAQYDLIIGGAAPNFNGTVLSIGANNQLLRVVSGALQYTYVGDLRDNSGNLSVETQGATSPVNYLRVQNASTGNPVVLQAFGTDTNINLRLLGLGPTGRVDISNNLMPNTQAPAFSVFATQGTAGNFQNVNAPTGLGDRVLYYDDTNQVITWQLVANIGGFNTINVTAGTGGSFSGTQPLQSSVSNTYTLNVADGLRAVASNTIPQSISLRLSFNSLTQITNINQVNPSQDLVAFYSVANQDHRALTFQQLLDLTSNVQVDELVVTTGGANLTITGFFSQVPISNDYVAVYVNGVLLRQTGWTRTGQDIQFVDSVNGYQIDSGDVIVARYQY